MKRLLCIVLAVISIMLFAGCNNVDTKSNIEIHTTPMTLQKKELIVLRLRVKVQL